MIPIILCPRAGYCFLTKILLSWVSAVLLVHTGYRVLVVDLVKYLPAHKCRQQHCDLTYHRGLLAATATETAASCFEC